MIVSIHTYKPRHAVASFSCDTATLLDDAEKGISLSVLVAAEQVPTLEFKGGETVVARDDNGVVLWMATMGHYGLAFTVEKI